MEKKITMKKKKSKSFQRVQLEKVEEQDRWKTEQHWNRYSRFLRITMFEIDFKRVWKMSRKTEKKVLELPTFRFL